MAAASLKRVAEGRQAGEEPSGGFGTVVPLLLLGVESRGAGNDQLLFRPAGVCERKGTHEWTDVKRRKKMRK